MTTLLPVLGAALIGGLILNVMPCVLPVLMFKVSGMIAHSQEDAARQRRDGVAYLGGVLAAFSALAIMVIALRASSHSLGWGVQMQNAGFVAFVIALLFVFALNALGVFSIYVSIGGGGPKGKGSLAAFFDGALITLVSTPCSAPFLGGAAAFALASTTAWWQTLLIFWAVGLGLALPVLAISFFPPLNRLLPRPGEWMNTFKHLVGFTLLGAAIWFFGTLVKLVTADAATNFLFFILALSMLLWAKEIFSVMQLSRLRRYGINIAGLALTVAVGIPTLGLEKASLHAAGPIAPALEILSVEGDEIAWTPYTEALQKESLAAGRPVFVDFTADWCATCKTFEKTHVNIEDVRAALVESGVLATKADLTADESLWDTLNALGRTGLPTYVIYLPDGTRHLFSEGAPSDLAAQLRAAGQRFPKPKK